MKAEHFSPDVQVFLRLLDAHDVRYLLIGEVAVIYHGYARFTGDIDFYYDRSPENAERLWSALLEFWDGSVPGIENAGELMDSDMVLQFGRPPNRIDLISDLPAVPFDVAWGQRIVETIRFSGDSVPVSIISLSDLIRSKRDAGRPKDLDDLQHLDDSEA